MSREKRTPKDDSKKGSRAEVKQKSVDKIEANKKKAREKLKEREKNRKSNGRKPSSTVVKKKRLQKET